MTKMKKINFRILSVALIISVFAGVFSMVGKSLSASAGSTVSAERTLADDTIRNVSEIVKTDTSEYFDPKVAYSASDLVYREGPISLIISVEGRAVADAYNAGGKDVSLSEYAASAEGRAIKNGSAKERKEIIRKLDAAGVRYEIGETYDMIISGLEITVDASEYEKVGKAVGDTASVIVGRVYEPALTTEVITNKVDVYDTGIFDSSKSRYQGDGVVVAVLDTGLDYTHTAFSLDNFSTSREKFTLDKTNNTIKVNPSNDPSDVYGIDVANTTAAGFSQGLTAQDVYMNAKVPYAYDYADKDPDVLPINSEHGTHVAGIIAGKDSEITGVAPNAQLAIMKVFSDTVTGAKTSWILAALDDCANIGVDVINMSLGSSCGFTEEDKEVADENRINRIYDKIKEAGISLIVSAGNSGSATSGSKKNGTNGLTSNPDSGTVGSPSTYSAALSVASVEGVSAPYIKFGDQIIYFNEATTSSAKKKNFVDDLLKNEGVDSKEYEYVTIPGIGKSSDYPNDEEFYHGKIVLVKRGESTFEEKIRIALLEKGAAGVIIYNNISGQISMQVGADVGAACSIAQDEGELLAKQGTGRILISRSNLAGPFMSDFSSWGPTSDLKIKPEITGHGGEIKSAVPGQSYDRLSGTSMAAPNVAGAVALIRQYVTYSGVFGNDLTPKQITAYVNRLVMSTADIVKNKNGLPASVRQQGAGLVNINNSVTTSAYISTYDADGNEMDKTKLELGDDKNKSGVYRMTLSVNNVTSGEISYDVSSVVLTEGVSSTYTGHDDTTVTKEGYLLSGAKAEVLSLTGSGSLSGSTITVGAGGSVKITIEISLSAEDKNYLDKSFANGMYVEGFIKLSAVKAATNLNVPFLAYYGNWNKAPIFDEEYYDTNKDEINAGLDEVDKLMADAYATRVVGGTYGDYIITLGEYVFVQNPSATQIAANKDKIALSNYLNDKDSSITYLRYINAGLLRNVKYWTFYVTDDATGEVVFVKEGKNQRKSFTSGADVSPSYLDIDFKTLENDLKNNAKYTAVLKTYTDYGDYGVQDAENARNTFTFPITVDFEAPVVTDVRYRTEYDKTTKKTSYFADIDIYDNHYAMAAHPGVMKEADAGSEYFFTTVSFGKYVVPVYSSFNSTSVITLNLTDYIDEIKQSAGLAFNDDGSYRIVKNTNSFVLTVYDYALNEATYEIKLPDEILGVAFSEEELDLNLNETKVITDLVSIYPSDSWISILNYDSSDPSVAEVVNGSLVAKSVGSTIITAYGKKPDGTRVEATIKINVGDDKKYTASEVNKFVLNGYETIKAFYDMSSSEREIGENGDIRDFGGSYSLSMFPSEIVKIRYTVDSYYPENTRVTFSVGNSRLASITEDGVLTALAKGNTTVTVNVQYNGKNTIYSNRISVSVKNPYNNASIYLYSYKGRGGFVDVPGDMGVTTINDYAFSLYRYVDKDLTQGDVIDKEDPYLMKPVPIGDADYKEGWEKITKIRLPEGVTTINSYAFSYLTGLEEVILPKSLATIGLGAFKGCVNLKTINLENVKFINQSAFMDCNLLTDVNLASVVAIGNGTFENCDLGRVVLPKCSRSLGIGAFKGNSHLTSIEFETKETIKIGANAFEGCVNLGSIKINAAVIAAHSFEGCGSLETVELGKDVAVIGEYAFAGTKVAAFRLDASNKNIHLDPSNPAMIYAGGDPSVNDKLVAVAPYYKGTVVGGNANVIVTDAVEISRGAFSGNKEVQTVVANSATKIGDYAFSGCTSLSVINLNSVSEIGEYAFEKTIISATPNLSNLSEIGAYAFAETSITSVVIPDGTVIGAHAFENCKALGSVEIGDNVVIGDYAFYNSFTLSSSGYKSYSYTVKDENGNDTTTVYTYYKMDLKEVVKSALTEVILGENTVVGVYAFAGHVRIADLGVGNGTKVGEYAFYNDVSITSVDFTKISSIGDYAFSGIYVEDKMLADASFVDAVEVVSYGGELIELDIIYTNFAPRIADANITASGIGVSAFEGNESLSAVGFADGLTEIGDAAFKNCTGITALTVPDSVERIGVGAFMNTSVTSVDLSKVKYVGAYAFANVPLTSVALADGAEIGAYAFADCESLGTVTGLSGLSVIGEGAFLYSDILSADITGVKELGSFAFGYSAVEEVTFGENLAYVGENPFVGCAIASYGKKENVYFNGVVVGEMFNENYDISDKVKVIDGVLYRVVPSGLELVSYPMDKAEKDYAVADGTRRIAARAFEGAKAVNVTFPHTVRSLGDKAFYGCANLNSVTFTSYFAPSFEEQFSEEYAFSGEGLPIEGNYFGFTGLGITRYNMWNLLTRTTNVYYGATFVDRIGKTSKNLVLISPSNGQNYDSFIFGQYFGTKIYGKTAATEQTLEVIALINSIPTEITLDDEDFIASIRAAYDKITSYEQKALINNYSALSNAESTILYLKMRRDEKEEPVDPVPPKSNNAFAVFMKGNIFGLSLTAVVLAGFVLYVVLSRRKSADKANAAADEVVGNDAVSTENEIPEDSGAGAENTETEEK